MDISSYIDEKKEIQNLLLEYIDDDSEDFQNSFSSLINHLDNIQITKDQAEFTSFLTLLSKVSKNYHRDSSFFDKIEAILQHFKTEIKQTYSNSAIFNFFKCNKRILYFLFESEMIVPNNKIIKLLYKKSDTKGKDYILYFSPHIKTAVSSSKRKKIDRMLSKLDSSIINNFTDLCKKGENEKYICKLIREDSVEEFITHVNASNISLKSQINHSFFETNPFLLDKTPTLIEYACFFGSIQIFNFLRMSNVELTPSLWIYAVHSKNAELFHILEDNHVKPDENYVDCDSKDPFAYLFNESVKCHHNSFAEYIKHNSVELQNMNPDKNLKFWKYVAFNSFHYYNYIFFPDDSLSSKSRKYTLLSACKYNYLKVVEFLIKSYKFDLNDVIILTKIIFLMKFKNKIFFFNEI